ncbi:MAG: exosortase/archaeosortase family protein [Armatimonas sp.]
MKKLTALWQFLRTERQWVVLGIVYLAAWWLPLSLLWPILRPGSAKPEGIDGPVSWLWKNHWGVTHSPISYQILIPVGVALLIYRYRNEAAAVLPRPGKKTPLILLAGCVTLAVSHLIHLPALSVGGLIVIAAGVVAQVYGLKVLKALRVPFLFWVLMIPPPESLAGAILKVLGPLSASLAGLSLKLIGKHVIVQPPQMVLNTVTMEVGSVGTEPSSGASIITYVGALLIFWGLYQRWRVGRILVALALGVFFAVLGNILRIDIALLLRGPAHSFSDFILQANSLLMGLFVSALVLWLDNRAGKLATTSTGWLGKLLASGWAASSKGTDRVIDSSAGVVKGAATGAGKVIYIVTYPFVFLLNGVVNGLGKLFGLFEASSDQMEKRWRKAEQARRNKTKKRGQM